MDGIINLVWHDQNIHNEENEYYYRTYLKDNAFRFENFNDTFNHLNTNKNKCIVITSGKNGKNLVERINDLDNILGIVIFCGNKHKHEEWAKNFSKITKIIDSGFIEVKKEIESIYLKSIKLNNFLDLNDKKSSKINLDKLNKDELEIFKIIYPDWTKIQDILKPYEEEWIFLYDYLLKEKKMDDFLSNLQIIKEKPYIINSLIKNKVLNYEEYLNKNAKSIYENLRIQLENNELDPIKIVQLFIQLFNEIKKIKELVTIHCYFLCIYVLLFNYFKKLINSTSRRTFYCNSTKFDNLLALKIITEKLLKDELFLDPHKKIYKSKLILINNYFTYIYTYSSLCLTKITPEFYSKIKFDIKKNTKNIPNLKKLNLADFNIKIDINLSIENPIYINEFFICFLPYDLTLEKILKRMSRMTSYNIYIGLKNLYALFINDKKSYDIANEIGILQNCTWNEWKDYIYTSYKYKQIRSYYDDDVDKINKIFNNKWITFKRDVKYKLIYEPVTFYFAIISLIFSILTLIQVLQQANIIKPINF